MASVHEIKFFYDKDELWVAFYKNSSCCSNESWCKNTKANELGLLDLRPDIKPEKKYSLETFDIEPFDEKELSNKELMFEMFHLIKPAINEDPRLSNLLTYTTFHLGVYISLIAAIIAANLNLLTKEGSNTRILQWSALWILVAGIFGGIIGSNITEVHNYTRLRRGRLSIFGSKLNIFGCKIMPNLKWCARIEHFAFWLGILPPTVLFIFTGKVAFPEPLVKFFADLGDWWSKSLDYFCSMYDSYW